MNQYILKDKFALVTGGARGIGKAIAIRYAQEGCNVAITGVNEKNVALALEELKQYDVKTLGFVSDASDSEEVKKTVNKVIQEFGRIDILVNNAGITKDGLLIRMTEDQWDTVINVNLKSAFNYINAVLPTMARQKSGCIINMASVVGISGNAGQANYAASKAGLIGLAKSVANEMGGRNIRANCIAPGFIESDMTKALPDEVRDDWAKKIPLKRSGKPEDVANVALFLASDLASYVTGQVIHCCGGLNC